MISLNSILRQGIRIVIPSKLRRELKRATVVHQFWKDVRYDARRFLKWSAFANRQLSQANLQALIVIDYHRVEKGLSLKTPRPGFGKDAVAALTANLRKYKARFGMDEIARTGIDTLHEYVEFSEAHGLNNEKLKRELQELCDPSPSPAPCCRKGGAMEVSREEIQKASGIDIGAFYSSRHSVRQFSDAPVEIALIQRAVALAQKTPSVCNRQTSRVHVFSTPEQISRILAMQNGNRGFGDQVKHLLVISSDVRYFAFAGERNQCWVDAGMFAMSLVYALHAMGLGSCCLNWTVGQETDLSMKRMTGISDAESIAMLIVVGALPEKLKVARSARLPLERVLSLHPNQRD